MHPYFQYAYVHIHDYVMCSFSLTRLAAGNMYEKEQSEGRMEESWAFEELLNWLGLDFLSPPSVVHGGVLSRVIYNNAPPFCPCFFPRLVREEGK